MDRWLLVILSDIPGVYSETYSNDWAKANFDVGKVDTSLGYLGASAGVYLAEASMEQTYKVFEKK